jgi:GxxExxY protein
MVLSPALITNHGGTKARRFSMLYGPEEDNALTDRIIGCGITVHRAFGPGLFESVYESAMCIELRAQGIAFKRQVSAPLYYRGELISEHRIDLVVADHVLVEIKSVESLNPVHLAQVITYLRVLNIRVGLLMNFNTAVLKHGIRRVMV